MKPSKAKTDAQTVLEEYQRQLADAKSEANRIIEESPPDRGSTA